MKIPINNDFGDDCLELAGKMSNFAGMDGLVIGLLIPLVGTVLGAGFVFFMRDTMPAWLQISVGTLLLGLYALVAWREIKSTKAI